MCCNYVFIVRSLELNYIYSNNNNPEEIEWWRRTIYDFSVKENFIDAGLVICIIKFSPVSHYISSAIIGGIKGERLDDKP